MFAQLGISCPTSPPHSTPTGSPVPAATLQPGDLVFFEALNHVGIYIGDDEFVDAPHTGAVVSIESLSNPWYTANYVGARRI